MAHNQVTKYVLSYLTATGRQTSVLASNIALTAIGSTAIYGICVDNSGDVYITDPSSHIIIKIFSNGRIQRFAGTTDLRGNNGAQTVSLSNALFDNPCGIDIDQAGNIYVADTGNNQIRKIGNNTVNLLAGDPNGTSGFAGTLTNPHLAKFSSPFDVKTDKAGRVYVADTANHAIRLIDGSKVVTIAGNGSVGDELGDPHTACLNSPNSLAVDKDGHVFIADTDNYKIKVIYGTDLFHFSGSGVMGNSLGNAQTSEYKIVKYLDIDKTGNIYAVNYDPSGDSEILRINSNGIPTIATEFSATSDAYVTGTSIDKAANIYVTESEYLEFDLESSSSSSITISYSSASSKSSTSSLSSLSSSASSDSSLSSLSSSASSDSSSSSLSSSTSSDSSLSSLSSSASSDSSLSSLSSSASSDSSLSSLSSSASSDSSLLSTSSQPPNSTSSFYILNMSSSSSSLSENFSFSSSSTIKFTSSESSSSTSSIMGYSEIYCASDFMPISINGTYVFSGYSESHPMWTNGSWSIRYCNCGSGGPPCWRFTVWGLHPELWRDVCGDDDVTGTYSETSGRTGLIFECPVSSQSSSSSTKIFSSSTSTSMVLNTKYSVYASGGGTRSFRQPRKEPDLTNKIVSRGHIYDTIEELSANEFASTHLLNKKNTVMAYAGTKVVNGINTGQSCVVVGVSEKKTRSNLNNEDIIPKTLPNGVITDVIKCDIIHALDTCTEGGGGACGIHGNRYRPLRGGISMVNQGSTAATLSLIVKDTTDNKLVALSCNHCLGQEYDTNFRTPDEGVADAVGLNVLQPSPNDGGTHPADTFGTVKRIVPLQFGTDGAQNNLTDTGIVTVDVGDAVSEILEYGYGPWLFTTKAGYSSTAEVFKSGRTTGITPPPTCTISNKNISINVCYVGGACGSDQNIAPFTNQILVTSSTRWSQGGDSGSAVLVDVTGNLEMIGVLFAGNAEGTQTYVTPSEYIVSELNADGWDGNVVVAYNDAEYISSNRICYSRSGNTTEPITHVVDQTFTSCVECEQEIFSSSSSTQILETSSSSSESSPSTTQILLSSNSSSSSISSSGSSPSSTSSSTSLAFSTTSVSSISTLSSSSESSSSSVSTLSSSSTLRQSTSSQSSLSSLSTSSSIITKSSSSSSSTSSIITKSSSSSSTSSIITKSSSSSSTSSIVTKSSSSYSSSTIVIKSTSSTINMSSSSHSTDTESSKSESEVSLSSLTVTESSQSSLSSSSVSTSTQTNSTSSSSTHLMSTSSTSSTARFSTSSNSTPSSTSSISSSSIVVKSSSLSSSTEIVSCPTSMSETSVSQSTFSESTFSRSSKSTSSSTLERSTSSSLEDRLPMSGMISWFESSRAENFNLVNGRVESWYDKSGSENNLLQKEPSLRPALSYSMNSIPTVKMTNTYLNMTDLSKFPSSNQSRTLFMAIRTPSIFTNRIYFRYGRDVGTSHFGLVAHNIGGCLLNKISLWFNSPNPCGSISLNTGTKYIVTCTFDSLTSIASTRIDGQTDISFTWDLLTGLDSGQIGGGASVSDQPSEIGEIIFYDRLLSNGEIETVEKYLSDKWAIEIKGWSSSESSSESSSTWGSTSSSSESSSISSLLTKSTSSTPSSIIRQTSSESSSSTFNSSSTVSNSSVSSIIQNLVSIVPTMTSDTTPSPYVISASKTDYRQPYCAFDGDYWFINGPLSNDWIKVDLSSQNADVVNHYKLQCAYLAYPQAWQLQGSNNDSDWDVLDSRSGVSWSQSETKYFYYIGNTTAYRYYRILITQGEPSGDSVGFYHIELFIKNDYLSSSISSSSQSSYSTELFTSFSSSISSSASISTSSTQILTSNSSSSASSSTDLLNFSTSSQSSIISKLVDVVPTMTGPSTPSPYVITESYYYSTSRGWKAFDTIGWSVGVGLPASINEWVKVDLSLINATLVNHYKIKSNSYRGPADWTLQGSNNDSDWNVLDTQTGHSWSGGETKYFYHIGNTTKYRYYRLYITKPNKWGELSINKIQLYREHEYSSESSEST